MESHMPRTLASRAGLAGLAALALAAAPAAAAPVTSATLGWTSVKVYDSGAPAGTDRTWLGYVTSPFPLANGSASASDGATGATVDAASAAGAAYTFGFPATGGDYEPATGEGTIQLDGTVSFTSPPPGPPPSGGHGFTITVANPRLTLRGNEGRLIASGLRSGSPAGYADAPVFDLDLSQATVALHADGSRTIAGIVPSVAETETVFPSPYVAGSGPDRTPNTFGSFALRVRVAPMPAVAVPGPAGPAGPQGAPGRVVRLQTAVLRRAPYPGGERHRIRLLRTKGRRVVATGSLRARTVRVRLLAGAPVGRLCGVYLLRIAGQPAVRVRVL
jgi:hypothetical protein